MKTLDIEIKMMQHLNIRQNIIVPNVSWGMYIGGKIMHECDLLMLSSSGYATEIEIKVSKSDLLKDDEKRHKHKHHCITQLYFAVPLKLKDVALNCIPERAGLYTLEKRKSDGCIFVKKEKKAIRRNPAIKWTDEDRFQLARLGTMRILGLKKKLNKALSC